MSPIILPNTSPKKQNNEETKLAITACRTLIPAANNATKSPDKQKRKSFSFIKII
jgi:hypothetical protein